jgi:predicted NodU family carbamoyl transferase
MLPLAEGTDFGGSLRVPATGVPMVLNTSFNENEPVVCRPDEALDCFLRTKMDVLVLQNHFLQRVVV